MIFRFTKIIYVEIQNNFCVLALSLIIMMTGYPIFAQADDLTTNQLADMVARISKTDDDSIISGKYPLGMQVACTTLAGRISKNDKSLAGIDELELSRSKSKCLLFEYWQNKRNEGLSKQKIQ